MKRLISNSLKQWKHKKNRKPLILKGVRQVGKTHSLTQFGKTEFSRVHYLNFEKNTKLSIVFQADFDVNRILDEISFLLDTVIDIQNDLLIFDEIQACPAALTSLKYFAEDRPELALCCAGSLLGLHLGESAFPVGKVDFFHMRPMSFYEFLYANGDHKSLDALERCVTTRILPEIIHAHLWNQFKRYMITGGLPEVVQTYLDNQDDLYTACQLAREKQHELIYGYDADIAKHAGKVNAMHIERVWRAVPAQLAQEKSKNRFQFKGIVPGVDRYARLADALDWLSAAELVIKVPIIDHVELPLRAYEDESWFKLYVFDIGILGAMSNLPPKAILDYDYGTYKGYVAENIIAQELLAKGVTQLHSWQHQRAEIEFLYSDDQGVIPLEVKAGQVTRNQSLNKYAEKYHPPYRAVLSARPLHIDLLHHYHQYPLYMMHWFPFE
ncbi:MAG: AAA family ATPase [Gammaproteobacteria bacterium]|nr:AAA family ATPase [Gammaproteobacteria bacterium]